MTIHASKLSTSKKYNKEVSHNDIKDFKEVSGKGIEFTYKKDKVKIGNPKYCAIKEESSNIYLTINNSLVADIEIKDEIKDAQKLFEVKSDIISNIMNKILVLSSLNRIVEASRYEKSLNRLLEDGEVWELDKLLDCINRDIEKFKEKS